MAYSLLWVTVRVAASLCLRGDASLLLTRDSCCLWVSKTHRPSFGLRAVLKVSLGSSLTCVENEGETETRGKTARHAADSAGQRHTASGILAVATGVSRTIAVCSSPSLQVFGDLQAEHNRIFFAGRIR